MGNTAGSHLFQTPSTSPTAPTPPRLLSPSSSPILEPQTLDTVMQESTVPVSGGAHSPPCSPQWESSASDNPTGDGWAPSDCAEQPLLAERDLEAVQKMAFSLIRLLEQHGASLGLSSGPGAGAGAAGLLKTLLAEREKMVAEIQSLKDTLKTEREEWEQFQSDLQVAVSVADRLRLEAEETLKSLRNAHTHTQQRLAETTSRQKQSERELQSVRAELTETQHTLHTLTSDHQHTLAELDTIRQSNKAKLNGDHRNRNQTGSEKEKRNQGTVMEQKCEISQTEEGEDPAERPELKAAEELEDHVLKIKCPQKPEVVKELEKCPGGGQETESRKTEEGILMMEPRKILMLSERSRSLSQIILPTQTSSVLHSSSQNLTSTASPVKNQEAAKGRRTDWLVPRQDSWSRSLRGKQEGDSSSDSTPVSCSKISRSQDGFSLLLRRYGGSRRNSLLRWCQTRTQGYRNIEITNFSSSWEDGLAFCALYHSYLPTQIPYSSLKPEEKKKNLDLAFSTGENVGIKAELTVEEMLREEGPDWQTVLCYVESMYRHFEM